MEQLLLDKDLQEQLDKDGIIMAPFLKKEELQKLRAFHAKMHPNGKVPQMRDGIHMTIWCSDKAYKLAIKEGITNIVKAACKRTFAPYRCINPVFIVKRKGADTTFPIHQDWSIIDERNHTAFNLWIPLEDVNEQNGALWFVKGSHHINTYIRGAGYLFPRLYDVEEHLRPKMTQYKVKAGHALIFYHRMIHGSPPNQIDMPRTVISMSIVPKEVPLQIYFQKGKETPLKIYQPADDFIYEFDNVRDDTGSVPPVGKLVATQPPYIPQAMTVDFFEQHLPPKQNPFLKVVKLVKKWVS